MDNDEKRTDKQMVPFKFVVECPDSYCERVTFELPECEDEEEYESELEDIMDDILERLFDETGFWEIVDDALASYNYETGEFFELDKIENELYDAAHAYINSLGSGMVCKYGFESSAADELLMVSAEQALSFLHGRINDRSWCEQSYCDVGQVVERSLTSFLDDASWHWGLRGSGRIISGNAIWSEASYKEERNEWSLAGELLEPVLWYGLDDVSPDSKWVISAGDFSNLESFWFESDSWKIMDYLISTEPNANNYSFLVWYLWENTRYSPEMDCLMDSCPIDFSRDDTPEDVDKKIREFMISNRIKEMN